MSERLIALNIQIIFSAAVIVFMVIFLAVTWIIYGGMKKFLRSNIGEVLIISGETICERVENLNSAMTKRMNTLENENRTLRAEITRQLEAISSIIADADDKSEIGINSIVKELNYIIPALRDEMKILLETLSQNAESFQKSTIRNFEAKINEFTATINNMCDKIRKSADDQSNTFAGMAGTIQSVMDSGTRNLQSEFTKTHSALKGIITDSMKQINADYQDNMKKMFQAMTDNLAAITQQLKTAGTNAEPEKKPGRKSTTKTPSENPKKPKENTPKKEKETANNAA